VTRLAVIDEEELRRIVREEVRAAKTDHDGVRLLTAEEAGAVLGGVGARTVLKWARERELPHRRLGDKTLRFVERELVEWSARKAG
jgi:excisionase family DNA binding protein